MKPKLAPILVGTITTLTLTHLSQGDFTKAEDSVNAMAALICRENAGHFYSLYSDFAELDLTPGQPARLWQVSAVYFSQFEAIMAVVDNVSSADRARMEQTENRYKRDLQAILTPHQWRMLQQTYDPGALGITPQQQAQIDWLQQRFEVEMSVHLPTPTPLQVAQAATLRQAYEQQLQAILTPVQYQQWAQADQRLERESIAHVAACTLK